MIKEIVRKSIGAILLVSLAALGFLQPVQDYLTFPKQITTFENQYVNVHSSLPVSGRSHESNAFTLSENGDHLAVTGTKSGSGEIELKVASFPVKKVAVNVLPEFKVIPGGQSIGVKLNTKGVLVVGHHLLDTANGKSSPGEKAGIQVGDVITKINNVTIEKMSEIAPFLNKAGEQGDSIVLEIKRDKKTLTAKLTPIKDKHDDGFRMGLYIRDSAAGIGTMTFYHPETRKYGALGHVISDMDTKKPIEVHDGHIVNSQVTAIEKGSNGKPGEKLAKFATDRKVIGSITRNSPFGIFGELTEDQDFRTSEAALPITLPHEVKEGPAKIRTVVKGDKIEEYEVEIVSTVSQKFPATKGMVIKITDPKLLKETGGIVQGMSGSPIIQNGKLVGAVTHVFVNDPTSGYGVHIEWMLNEAGIDIYGEKQQKAS